MILPRTHSMNKLTRRQRPCRPPYCRNASTRPLLLRGQPLQLPRHRALRQDQRRFLGDCYSRLDYRFRRPIFTPPVTASSRCLVSRAERQPRKFDSKLPDPTKREKACSSRAAVCVDDVWRGGKKCHGEADCGAVQLGELNWMIEMGESRLVMNSFVLSRSSCVAFSAFCLELARYP